MPRATKDTKKEEKEKKTKTVTKTTKKATTKKTATEKKTTTKKVVAKKTTSKAKSTTTKGTATKKTTTAKTTTKKKTTTTKAKKLDTSIVAEYYDLPYRYNETIVKILYQTPAILFVYWDISDDDRNHFVEQYGEDFFNTTYPVLRIFNLTKGYDFEVPINDFANSWYIHTNDAGCDYKVELHRKPIEHQSSVQEDVYISTSNDIEFPNDHILLEQLPNVLRFKNVKTNEVTMRDISTLRFIGIKGIHSIYDFYKKLFKDEILDEINGKKFMNPSSSSWS